MNYFFLFFTFAFAFKGFSQKQFLIVGTYDSPKSDGIYVYGFNKLNGSARLVSKVKTSNPSYIVASPNKHFLYTVNENANKKGNGGSVTSFAFNKNTGELSKINSQSSEGNHPCYITIDKSGSWLIAGNYSSGNFAIFPVNKKGSITASTQTIQNYGKSIDTVRQNSPHVLTYRS